VITSIRGRIGALHQHLFLRARDNLSAPKFARQQKAGGPGRFAGLVVAVQVTVVGATFPTGALTADRADRYFATRYVLQKLNGNLEQYSLSAISALAERAVTALVPR